MFLFRHLQRRKNWQVSAHNIWKNKKGLSLCFSLILQWSYLYYFSHQHHLFITILWVNRFFNCESKLMNSEHKVAKQLEKRIFFKYCLLVISNGCVCSLTDINKESEIVKSGSNSRLVCCIYFAHMPVTKIWICLFFLLPVID